MPKLPFEITLPDGSTDSEQWIADYADYSKKEFSTCYEQFHTVNALWLLNSIIANRVVSNGSKDTIQLNFLLADESGSGKTNSANIAYKVLKNVIGDRAIAKRSITPQFLMKLMSGKVPFAG